MGSCSFNLLRPLCSVSLSLVFQFVYLPADGLANSGEFIRKCRERKCRIHILRFSWVVTCRITNCCRFHAISFQGRSVRNRLLSHSLLITDKSRWKIADGKRSRLIRAVKHKEDNFLSSSEDRIACSTILEIFACHSSLSWSYLCGVQHLTDCLLPLHNLLQSFYKRITCTESDVILIKYPDNRLSSPLIMVIS